MDDLFLLLLGIEVMMLGLLAAAALVALIEKIKQEMKR